MELNRVDVSSAVEERQALDVVMFQSILKHLQYKISFETNQGSCNKICLTSALLPLRVKNGKRQGIAYGRKGLMLASRCFFLWAGQGWELQETQWQIISNTLMQFLMNVQINFMFKVVCLHVCLCPTCVPSAPRGLKRLCNFLELELQMVVFKHKFFSLYF